MSLTFWNRRRREAAEAGEERDPEEVIEAAASTAGEGGTEGAEGHTGTDHTEPPLGAPEESGSETDASGETHEVAAAETDPEASAQEAADAANTAPEGDEPQEDVNGAETAAQPQEEALEKPAGNASTADWTAWALDPRGGGKTEEDLVGLNRDAIRDLFA
ncbi:hypothetical protein SEA_GINGERBUG_10 [Microbacterium phage Gingerbug]|nr:hypothetical protein SEA_GINGERBUG_10 [Microbacterium phage Gingerbug]